MPDALWVENSDAKIQVLGFVVSSCISSNRQPLSSAKRATVVAPMNSVGTARGHHEHKGHIPAQEIAA